MLARKVCLCCLLALAHSDCDRYRIRMFRVVILSAGSLLVGCAREQPPMPRVATKVVVKTMPAKDACPTRDEIADAMIASSRYVYASAPGSSRTCACPGDTYMNGARVVVCGSHEAGAAGTPAAWGYCKREQVPDDLIAIAAKSFAACR